MRKDVGAMSLLSRLLHTVHSWRYRGGGPRTKRRTAVTMEQLDHRQLLTINFTGVVANDFPQSMQPGVVVLPDNPNVVHPTIAPNLQPIIKVSGFDISGLRVSYDPRSDTLSIGIEQPPSQRSGDPLPVIAGDADNNGDDGTVSQAVLTQAPTFKDPADFGQTEHMAVFLDLTGTGVPDVVAGFDQFDPRTPKQYQVAQAIVNPGTNVPPSFGTMLPQFTGSFFKENSSQHPGFELNISHFSQLYLQETGKQLTPSSLIGMGAWAGSGQDIGVSEAFFPEQTFPVGAATPPPPPPLTPPVAINPHQHNHINTAHPGLIRTTIFGSPTFDVTQIVPSSVTMGGAHPVMAFTRHANRDPFLDETFVFEGTQVNLPPGVIQATVTGALTNGQTFQSSETVFNRNYSFYSQGAALQQQNRWATRGGARPDLPGLISNLEGRNRPGVTFTYPPVGSNTALSAESLPAPQPQVISIPTRQAGPAVQHQSPRLSARLEQSMSGFVHAQGSAAAGASAGAG